MGLLNLPVTEKADKDAPKLLTDIAQKNGKMIMEAKSDMRSSILALNEK